MRKKRLKTAKCLLFPTYLQSFLSFIFRLFQQKHVLGSPPAPFAHDLQGKSVHYISTTTYTNRIVSIGINCLQNNNDICICGCAGLMAYWLTAAPTTPMQWLLAGSSLPPSHKLNLWEDSPLLRRIIRKLDRQIWMKYIIFFILSQWMAELLGTTGDHLHWEHRQIGCLKCPGLWVSDLISHLLTVD